LRPVLRLRFGFRTTSGLPGMSSRKPSVLSLRVSPGVDRSSESGVAVRDAMVGIGLRLWKSVLYFDSGELSTPCCGRPQRWGRPSSCVLRRVS